MCLIERPWSFVLPHHCIALSVTVVLLKDIINKMKNIVKMFWILMTVLDTRNCIELKVGIPLNNYLSYWKHDPDQPQNAKKWNGFYGELLVALQDTTNISMKVVDFNNSWIKIGLLLF